jgi:hypothetical protein
MGTFYTNLLPQYFTLKMEAGLSFEMSANEYQNIRRHNQEGPDFYTAWEKVYFGRYIAGKLEEVGCEVRKGIEVA